LKIQAFTILLLALVALSPMMILSPRPVSATLTRPFVGVWAPAYHSANITDNGLGVGATFTVQVNVTDVQKTNGFGINAYQFTLSFNPNFLLVPANGVDSTSGSTFFQGSGTDLGSGIQGGSVNVVVFSPGTDFIGTGVLAFITFKVVAVGFSFLTLGPAAGSTVGPSDTALISSGTSVPLDVQSGVFNNSGILPPIASFKYTWTDTNKDGKITQGETVNFNASLTTGGAPPYIFSWDFGDGSSTINLNANPIIPHVFNTGNGKFPSFGNFTVMLTVTDKNQFSSGMTQYVFVNEFQFHDLAVQTLALKPERPNPGDTVQVSYSIRNNGTYTEGDTSRNEPPVKVTLYLEDTVLQTNIFPDVEKEKIIALEFDLSTSGITQGIPTRIRVSVDPVRNQTTGQIIETNTENNERTAYLAVSNQVQYSLLSFALGGGILIALVGVSAYALKRRMKSPEEEE